MTGVYSGYLIARAYPEALVYPFDVPQTRQGRVTVESIKAVLEREAVDSIWLHSAGVYGRDWLSEATLYKIDKNGVKTAITSFGTKAFVSENIWNVPHLTDVMVELTAGDFLQWVCTYDSTRTPPLSPDNPLPVGPDHSIESGDSFFWNFGCDIGAVFSNSRCGSAAFSPDMKLPRDCLDPLFKPVDNSAEEAQVHLVYDYNPLHGACSDGGQWPKHPYLCTKMYDGGQCAFCVGRANNIESRTCIDRQGQECNAMFNSRERKTWCNMEFECPAASIAVPLVTLILAIVALLV